MTETERYPIELRLVDEVKNCRTCTWFWGEQPAYGPYPAFDFNMARRFPPEMADIDSDQGADCACNTPQPWITGVCVGAQYMDPAIMHGCRKAPIMTIGINPNLTAYYPAQTSSEWAYPYFTDPARYAYYYRYQTIYQESLPGELIRKWLDRECRLVAEQDGELTRAERCRGFRWIRLTYRYDGSDIDRHWETDWLDGRAVVIAGGKSTGAVFSALEQGETIRFSKDDVLAGKLRPEKEAQIQVYKNAVGYYCRMNPVLENFKRRIPELASANIRIGEDVAQHDFIHCASPKWNKDMDVPIEAITDNCARDRRFLLRQLFMSRPKVLIVVSNSAFTMLCDVLPGCIPADLQGMGGFQQFQETCLRETCVELRDGDRSFTTRLIVTPHFSYADNFDPQCRFSTASWAAFANDFPADQKVLAEEGRVKPPNGTGTYVVRIASADDPVREKLSMAAWQLLMGRFIVPFDLLGEALAVEYRKGNLRYDGKNNRLQRADGDCRFCVNDRWQFPQGCPYDKVPE